MAEQFASGMLLNRRDHAERDIGGWADITDNPVLGQPPHQVGALNSPPAVRDPGRAQLVEGLGHAVRAARLARVSHDLEPCGPCDFRRPGESLQAGRLVEPGGAESRHACGGAGELRRQAGQVLRDRQVLVGVDRHVRADLDLPLTLKRLQHDPGDLGQAAQAWRIKLRLNGRLQVHDTLGRFGAHQRPAQRGQVVQVVDQVGDGPVSLEERPDISEGPRRVNCHPAPGRQGADGIQRVRAVEVRVDVNLRKAGELAVRRDRAGGLDSAALSGAARHVAGRRSTHMPSQMPRSRRWMPRV